MLISHQKFKVAAKKVFVDKWAVNPSTDYHYLVCNYLFSKSTKVINNAYPKISKWKHVFVNKLTLHYVHVHDHIDQYIQVRRRNAIIFPLAVATNSHIVLE